MYRRKKLTLIIVFQLLLASGWCQPNQKNFLKGMLSYQKGHYEEAILQFRQCLNDAATDSAVVFNALGNAYTYAQEYEKAIPAFQAALDLGFSNPEAIYFMLSTVYYNKKDFLKSFGYCTRILDSNKDCMDAKVYWRMNLIYSLKNESGKAVLILKKGAKTGIKELQVYCDQRRIIWQDYAEAELKKVQ